MLMKMTVPEIAVSALALWLIIAYALYSIFEFARAIAS